MSLPATPNKTIPRSLKQGDDGWPVFALQRGLVACGYPLTADGSFGPITDRLVKSFQSEKKLATDGIAGAGTQGAIIAEIDAATHRKHTELPTGMLRGFATAEGGNNLGAVNWSVAGGVDCGVVQIRCYGAPFEESAMRQAYDPAAAMDLVAVAFLRRTDALRGLPFARRMPIEFAKRCAALNWNWPYAAEQYAMRGGLGASAGKNATWATYTEGGQTKRVRFPDGAPVMTWKDWAEFYALSGDHGEGSVTRYVKDWT